MLLYVEVKWSGLSDGCGEQRPQGGCAGFEKEGNLPLPFSRYRFTQAIVGNGELPIEKISLQLSWYWAVVTFRLRGQSHCLEGTLLS